MNSTKLWNIRDAAFINSWKRKTSDHHRLLLNLSDKIKLKNVINMFLYKILAYTKYKKSIYIDNKFKILAPTWNEEFELPYGSYSLSDIQDNFKCIIKKDEALTDSPPVRITMIIIN